MITQTLTYVNSIGIDLWLESDKLKFKAEKGILSADIRNQLNKHKDQIIERLKQNIQAAKDGWLVSNFGGVYSKRTSWNGEVFILEEDKGLYTVWRGNWKDGDSQSFKERTLLSNAPFGKALKTANEHCNWTKRT